MKNNKCAIIIPSCDAYSDVWEPFFIMFFRYWPDCPFPIYLVTDSTKYPDSRVNTFTLGKDYGWGRNMRIVLEKLNFPYFIYMLEDIPFRKKVDSDRILKLLSIIEKENAAYLRLYPSPGPDKRYKNYKEVGEINKNANYRTSLLPAIWETKTFLDLLIEGENAWQMELEGTKRSREIKKPFLSVKRSPILNRNNNPAIDCLCTAVKKGKWLYNAVKFLEKNGVKIDKNKREVETLGTYILRKSERLPFFIGKGIGYLRRNLTK